MDLPPSGWYPDPYGAPDLLRWWDGSTWTHHTHPGVAAEDSSSGGAGGAQPTTVQPAAVQAEVAQTTVGQALGGQSTAGGWATRDRVIGDWAGTDWPSGDLLANTKPPKGPRTEPQPALPDNSVQPTTHQPAVQATAYQRPVQPTVYQPAVSSAGSVGATTVQPSNGWGTPGQYGGGPYNGGGQGSTAYPGPTAGAGGAGGAGGGDGTQVLFLGDDAWQVPGGPSGPGAPNRYGYQQAQQRRRLWLIGGLVAGTAVAIAIIVIVATSLGGSHGAGAADQAATLPAAATPTAAAATPTPSPTASAAASVSASATAPASVLSDGQSGLSYAQLATPWTPICPSDLNGAFPWTAGESAVAGQINGGQTAWYGEACSGPLPAQYNYSSVRDLENTATNVAQTLENAYYNALNHTIAPELSEPVTVSGHPGWEIEYLVSYTNAPAQGATWTSEEGAVVVTDTGTGNTPVVFFTSVPDTLGQTNVASLVSSLQLTVVPAVSTVSPPASVTPPAGVTPTAAGSPTTTPGANP